MKETKSEIEEIKDSIDDKKVVLGATVTIKALKGSQLRKIFLSANCAEAAKKDIEYYASFHNIPVAQLNYPSDEVGVICKKPFSIAVLGLLK
ncbi:ribosomal L7Ae/L30e/S12e/Gadd45 family protein [Candidatus Woesearchaeota archaeon]|nr:ribosomal L7Ae/L30e/S12e/Gadd45 family protein [Candidatus Woesearchaeota archaeon]